jgi:hypothetical protein
MCDKRKVNGLANYWIIKWAQVLIHIQRVIQPPLWSIGQSSWLQIQRSGFDFLRYQIFWEVVGPPSLVSTIEELLGRKSGGSGLVSREYGCRDPSSLPRGTLYPQKFGTLTSPTSGGHSVGIVRSWTQTTEFVTTCNHQRQARLGEVLAVCNPSCRIEGYLCAWWVTRDKRESSCGQL